MKKQALLNRIEKLEAELADLRLQVVLLSRPAPVNPWTAPFPKHPPWSPSPLTIPLPQVWPGTICEVARAN